MYMDQKILKELQEIKKSLTNVVTKEEAKFFATKNDLVAMENRLTKEIKDVEINVTVSADKNKAEKADLEKLERRVDKIEQKLAH
jgi:hypothetical protein